ncbi:MAG TPA: ATP synthase subunit C [Clostridiaceae bacterium]|jgi:V/A-type H+-transporting ATPase subunit K|nr:ATP synthase subunit C [Clostridiaceae bacterium]
MLKRVLVVVFILILGGCIYSTKINSSYAVEETESSTVNEAVQEKDKGTSLIAAALAVGLAAIGSGIAVAVVASSAVGAISENPSLLGKTVIFAGLAEGIAIYGLIVSIMILSKV